jgi:hypothetical protein
MHTISLEINSGSQILLAYYQHLTCHPSLHAVPLLRSDKLADCETERETPNLSVGCCKYIGIMRLDVSGCLVVGVLGVLGGGVRVSGLTRASQRTG